MKKKSLIIIGAGMTGLSSGLTWALNNDLNEKPVLILEKNKIPGGYVCSFRRKGYLFDVTQMISGVENILEYFGIKMELKTFDKYFMRLFRADTSSGKAEIFNIPSGKEAFGAYLEKAAPEEADKIKVFMDYSENMFRELYKLKYEPTKFELMKAFFSCPKVIKNVGRTYKDYVDRFGIRNNKVRDILNIFPGFCGMPESRIASLLPVGVLYSLLESAQRPAKGFIELPVKMFKRYKALGGEARFGAEVEKIIVENEKVKGVRLSDGEEIYSDYVITTGDVNFTLNKLVGSYGNGSKAKNYEEKIRNSEMTTSSFHVNLGLDDKINLAGFDCGYNLLTTGGDTFEKLYAAFRNGNEGINENLFHIGVSCASAITEGKPVLNIGAVPFGAERWIKMRNEDKEKYDEEKNRLAETLIKIVEKYMLPGLSEHIVVKDICTPATFARYSGSPTGSIYNMAAVPDNFGLKRLGLRTPIKGLVQPQFSHGVFGTLNGGIQAADCLMKRKATGGRSRF